MDGLASNFFLFFRKSPCWRTALIFGTLLGFNSRGGPIQSIQFNMMIQQMIEKEKFSRNSLVIVKCTTHLLVVTPPT